MVVTKRKMHGFLDFEGQIEAAEGSMEESEDDGELVHDMLTEELDIERENDRGYRQTDMGRCARACRLLPTLLKRYWFAVAWTASCSVMFYHDYSRYKKEPQYYYIRRMLGLGMCISRGSAAVLNLSCCCLVLPMCRALTTVLEAALSRPHHHQPTVLATLAVPATRAAKTTHLIIATTVILSAVVHSAAHLVNAYNFSRNYSNLYPELNVASYKGESPVQIFISTVPGVTGVGMVVVLVLVGISSWHRVRRSHYNLFYYTHHLGLVFLLLLVIHPLGGVLKEQRNLNGHFPGCQMHRESFEKEEFPEHDTSLDLGHSRQNMTGSDYSYPEPPPDMENGSLVPLVDMEYGYPEPSLDVSSGYPEPHLDYEYGYPEPVPELDYGYPEPLPNMDYAYPEPLPKLDYGYPEPLPELDYGYPEPVPELDYGYPEPVPELDYGYPEPIPNMDYGYPEPIPNMDYGYPEPSPDESFGFYDSSQGESRVESSPHHGSYQYSQGLEHIGPPKDSERLPKKSRHGKKRKGRKCLKPPEFAAVNTRTYVWVGVALLMWGLDWMVRWVRRWQHEGKEGAKLARVIFLPCNVVQLTFSLHSFTCKPGQYVLLRCPRVSRFEWHPFTVISAGRDTNTLTVLIQARGDWTGRVTTLLRSHCYPTTIPRYNVLPASCSSHSPCQNLLLQSRIGKAKQKRYSKHGNHKVFKARNYSYTLQDRLSRLEADWDGYITEHTEENTYRDVHIPLLPDVRFHIDGPFSSPSEALLSYPVVIGTAGGMGITPLAATLHHIRWCPSTWPQRVHIVWVVRDAKLLLSVAPLLSSLLNHCWEAHTEDRLELCLHVTKPTPPHLQELLAKYPNLLPRISKGRPIWKNLFREWRLIYEMNQVGVFSCGPSKMRRQVKRHCLNAVSKGVAFHYHQEVFS
ncbi:hypothetical protein Pcinc_029245 [Petrolisthes cinctipes]|uniref:FAD-binding FR-type domain-containing protein n=1 Tax=Petrolisthes cinctipes TaxID=88211 RepID=A0AAE1F1C4_PETCI|nr:hypothetical protein Pcinc_029245 [Petrolisthes cinctipes]